MIFEFVIDILVAAAWFVIFLFALIIGSPIAFGIWLVKRQKKFTDYWNDTIVTIVRLFFRNFGN